MEGSEMQKWIFQDLDPDSFDGFFAKNDPLIAICHFLPIKIKR